MVERLAEIYYHDELTREQSMSAEERLRFHQAHGGPVMDQLHTWLRTQFQEEGGSPNSGLGQAISYAYLLKHCHELTLFLRQPGAPLDTNICTAASGSTDHVVGGAPGSRRIKVSACQRRNGFV